uniref:Uncharacterized protein n=1 Tax=Sander lucioperca TaxID=283035 RepID=A0A8C9ZF18_SANLU
MNEIPTVPIYYIEMKKLAMICLTFPWCVF